MGSVATFVGVSISHCLGSGTGGRRHERWNPGCHVSEEHGAARSASAWVSPGLSRFGWKIGSKEMRRRHALLLPVAFAIVGYAVPSVRADVVFTTIGTHQFPFYAEGVSGDGARVVGLQSVFAGYEAGVWSPDTGVVSTGISVRYPTGSFSRRLSISADGGTIVGTLLNGGPFRLRIGESVEPIVVPGAMTFTWGIAASGSGDVVVGFDTGGLSAFRWTSDTGPVAIGAPAGTVFARAFDLAADGHHAVVAGSVSGTGTSRVFRVDTAGTADDTTITTWVSQGANALAISGDGLCIAAPVRSLMNEPGPLAIWREGLGVEVVGLPPGAHSVDAAAMSFDGRTVVGIALGSSGVRAYLWSVDLGMVDLQTLIAASGVDLSDWQLQRATGVSADGLTIVGQGQHRVNGEWFDQSWIVTIPAPSTCSAAAAVGVLAAIRRRRAMS